jgi:hypothetical protein
VLEALARARLPKVTRLPPHMHVSSYYDHVKPAMPLEQVCWHSQGAWTLCKVFPDWVTA